MSRQIQLFDLTDSTQNHAAIFDEIQSTGFVRIIGHDIDQELIQSALEQTKLLFDLPLKSKERYQSEPLGVRGYTGFGLEHAKGHQHGDLKEFWHIGPDLPRSSQYFSVYTKNTWPDELTEFKATMQTLYAELQTLAHRLLRIIASGLGLAMDVFSPITHDGNSVLRLIHYPPLAQTPESPGLRAAPHADINLITLLLGATDSGLQILDGDEWIDIHSNANEIIVDTGDMMALLTGGQLPSTIHQVVNPQSQSTSRYSMPFFVHPHSNAKLSCFSELGGQANEDDITAGEFLEQRLAENKLA